MYNLKNLWSVYYKFKRTNCYAYSVVYQFYFLYREVMSITMQENTWLHLISSSGLTKKPTQLKYIFQQICSSSNHVGIYSRAKVPQRTKELFLSPTKTILPVVTIFVYPIAEVSKLISSTKENSWNSNASSHCMLL